MKKQAAGGRSRKEADTYAPPGPRVLARMTPAQRRADYIETFAGEVGQRVLFDLLHRVLMHGASPFPPGPDPSALLLAKTAGKQEAAAEILEIMTIPLVQVTEGNLRSYTHED